MTGNENVGDGPAKPADNVYPFPTIRRHEDPDKKRARIEQGDAFPAGENYKKNLRDTPTIARTLHFLTQNTDIYDQIKNARETPEPPIWLTRPPAHVRGIRINKLQEFFENVPDTEKGAAIRAIKGWLQDKFGQTTPLCPRISRVEIEGVASYPRHYIIQWVPASDADDEDEDPHSPAE